MFSQAAQNHDLIAQNFDTLVATNNKFEDVNHKQKFEVL